MYSIVQHPSPNHSARTEAPSAIVLHHGAGTRKSDLSWLCNPASKVSAHYYVCRDATIYQLVDEARTAWHAGNATISNEQSIGIETEHTTLPELPIQHTDWPQSQLDALTWLIGDIRTRYPIPNERVVSHRAIAMPKGRKHDPAHSPLAPEPSFRAWVAGLRTPSTPAPSGYTEYSPILGQPQATRASLRFSGKHGGYSALDVDTILDAYYELAVPVGVDPVVAIAQMLHETGDLISFWSQRPQRNPAGIGVTGQYSDTKPIDTSRWKYNTQRKRWEVGLSFSGWATDSIPVHLGRLLSYALPAATGTQAQQALIQRSNAARPLPIRARGSATVLRELGHAHNSAMVGWATPGELYGQMIAKRANRLIGVNG